MGLHSCLLLLLLFTVSTEPAFPPDCGFPPSDPCAPVTDAVCFGCPLGETKVPDPFDCHSYYVCWGDVLAYPVSLDCPDGMIFDINTRFCEPGLSCEPLCKSPVGMHCPYTCMADPFNDIALADPYDCNIYYQCFAGNHGPALGCPSAAPYFDGASCQKDLTHCCHCRPYCYPRDMGQLVNDPRDCRKYYLCLYEGTPDISGECLPNEYFDFHQQACLPNVPCITACKNVVGSDGCIDPFTCVEQGYFAKCPYKCVPEYYHCTETGDTYIDADTCPNGSVFHPGTSECVTNSNCPYN